MPPRVIKSNRHLRAALAKRRGAKKNKKCMQDKPRARPVCI